MPGPGQGYGADTDAIATGSVSAADLAVQGQAMAQQMIDMLKGTIWQGPASQIFQGKVDDMQVDAQRIHNALSWLADKLGGAGGRYVTAEFDGQSLVQNNTAGIGSIGNQLRQV